MTEKPVEIHCDGSCLKPSGPGGWAFVIVEKYKIVDSQSGKAEKTTHNQMELQAAISALECVPKNIPIKICSDSTYLVYGMNKWLARWLKQKAGRRHMNRKLKNEDY